MSPEAKTTDPLTRKYVAHVCPECGTLTEGLADRCRGCVEKSWWRDAMRQQRAILRGLPHLELARDRRAQHVALVGYGEFAFCHVKLAQSKRKRKLVAPGEQLPADICAACHAALKEVQGELE